MRPEGINMLVTLNDSPIFDGIWHSRNGDAHVIPEVWVVCPKCSGEGKISNPAFDGMSLSEIDDCDRDDFMDGYMSRPIRRGLLPMQGAHHRQRV